MWWSPGCGGLLDVVVSWMWWSPGCGGLLDVMVSWMLMPVTVLTILAFSGSVRVEAAIEGGPLESVWLKDFASRYVLFAATVLMLAPTEMIPSMSVLVPGPTAVVLNPYHSCDAVRRMSQSNPYPVEI